MSAAAHLNKIKNIMMEMIDTSIDASFQILVFQVGDLSSASPAHRTSHPRFLIQFYCRICVKGLVV